MKTLQTSNQFQMLSEERKTLVQAMLAMPAAGKQETVADVTVASQQLLDQSVAIALLDQENNNDRRAPLGSERNRSALVSSLAARSKAELKLLELLSFPVMSDRYKGISEAHRKTYEWVFQNQPSGAWNSLPGWLSQGSGSGIYWVKGVPASGKSTMMKYIFDSPKTRELLEPWAGEQVLTTAAFFFWNSGSAIERSQNGLLRSLLYTVLHQQPQLLPVVLHHQWSVLYQKYAMPTLDEDQKIEPWTQKELQDAFKMLIAQKLVPLRLFLLVDGLDEYDGEQKEIVNLFQEISSSSNVKAIVSSRPLDVIEEAFVTCPHLSLDELNHDDIRIFVSDTLRDNTRFSEFAQLDPTLAETTIEAIKTEASGVFLQAQLLIDSLLKQFNNESSNALETARKIIKSSTAYEAESGKSPEALSLDDIFHSTWATISPGYHTEASQIIQIMQAARVIRKHSVADGEEGDPLMLIDLVLAIDMDAKDIIEPPAVKSWNIVEVEELCKKVANRVQPELSGFVKLRNPSADNNAVIGPSWRVEYLHRAARDYMDRYTNTKLLPYTATTSFDPYLSLLQSYVQHLKILDKQQASNRDLRWYLTTSSLLCAHHFETNNHIDNIYSALLEALDKAMAEHHVASYKDDEGRWKEKKLVYETRMQNDGGWASQQDAALHWTNLHPPYTQPKEWKNNFLSLVIQFGLSKYLDQSLGNGDRLLKDKKGRPLLDYALSPLPDLHPDLITKDVVEVLLRHGAEPNEAFKTEKCGKRTCWQNALLWQYEQSTASRGKLSTITPKAQKIAEMRLMIFQLLIEKGASVSASVKNPTIKRRSR
jgi:hypothetical protein